MIFQLKLTALNLFQNTRFLSHFCFQSSPGRQAPEIPFSPLHSRNRHTNKCSWGEEQAAELLLAAPPVAVLLATFHPPRVHTLLPSSLVPSPVSLHHLLSQGSFLNRLCWPLAVISPSFPRERSLYFLWVPPPHSADALKSRYHVENSRIVTSLCSSQTCEFLEDTGYVWFHVLVLYLSRFLPHGL